MFAEVQWHAGQSAAHGSAGRQAGQSAAHMQAGQAGRRGHSLLPSILPFKGSGKGGFIVAELIVVLLIMALLAAILFPRVLGNIQVAKENAEIAATHTVTVTLQSLLTMTYGREIVDDNGDPLSLADLTYFDVLDRSNVKLTPVAYREMEDLAGTSFGVVERIVLKDKITLYSFRYTTTQGATVDYNSGDYFVIKMH